MDVPEGERALCTAVMRCSDLDDRGARDVCLARAFSGEPNVVAEVPEAEERAAEVEAQIAEAEAQVVAAERAAAQAEAQAAEAEAQAAEAEARAREAQARTAAAEARAAQVQAEAEEVARREAERAAELALESAERAAREAEPAAKERRSLIGRLLNRRPRDEVVVEERDVEAVREEAFTAIRFVIPKQFDGVITAVVPLARDRQLISIDDRLVFEGTSVFDLDDNVDVVRLSNVGAGRFRITSSAGRPANMARIRCERQDDLRRDHRRKCRVLPSNWCVLRGPAFLSFF